MTEIAAKAAPDYQLIRPKDAPGRLNIYVTVIDGRIVLDFGRVVEWVGFTPEEAEKVAADLVNGARVARTLHLPLE